MNNRKLKKLMKPGTLYTIIGGHCVFVNMGGFKRTSKGLSPYAFNGIDLKERCWVSRCDGRCRLATEKEQKLYWNIIKELTYNLAPGQRIVYNCNERHAKD